MIVPGRQVFQKRRLPTRTDSGGDWKESLVSDLSLNPGCHLMCNVHQFSGPSVGGFQVTSGMSLNEELGGETRSASGLTIVASVSSSVKWANSASLKVLE